MLRVCMAGIVTVAAALALGIMLAAMLAGCGDDGAKCHRETEDSGDTYLVCKAGEHQVVYELDPNGQIIERPDGKVDYAIPKDDAQRAYAAPE